MAHEHHSRHADCDYCGNNLDFELPDELLAGFHDGSLVIFAGAGISTESRTVFGYTFYDEIAADLPADDRDGSFPTVMQAFEDRFGRVELLQRLKRRFDYAYSFIEILNSATQFHRELSTIPSLADIVTTNFDLFFEEECLATAIAEPMDYAFWGLPSRRVVKIHGSISNLGSLVLTQKDYDRCYRRLRSGVIGSTLKHALATRPVLFIGYSLTDSDFSRIYRLLKHELGGASPRAYIVTLSEEPPPPVAAGATVIRTDGTHFLHEVKRHLVEARHMIPDRRFDGLWEIFERVGEVNVDLYEQFSTQDEPSIIYAACYQNGLQHALQRIMARRRAGEYSSPQLNVMRVERYFAAEKHHRSKRNYTDAAYCHGYANGVLLPLLDTKRSRSSLPLYYAFGEPDEIRTLRQYRAALRRAPTAHKTAWRAAAKLAASLPSDMVYRHTAFVSVP